MPRLFPLKQCKYSGMGNAMVGEVHMQLNEFWDFWWKLTDLLRADAVG